MTSITDASVGAQPTDDELVDMMTTMIAARVYSTRLFNLQRQGRAGTSAPVDGHEALVVGAASALDPSADWVVPQYREQVALGRFGHGIIAQHVRYQMGDPAGASYGPDVRVLPIAISLASQVPHAVGLAWGLKLRGERGVVVCFLGDGASSEGDFYEAANLAGVVDAPVVLVVANNHWAISTPASIQTAAESFAAKAAAFGMPGVHVDGRDPVAMREVVAAARARALAGDGPTLVEAETYRLGPHTTADDPTRYVPNEEIDRARAADPLVTFGARLRELGLWDDERHAAAEAEAGARMDEAVERAEATTLAPTAMFDHVFAEDTPRMRRQRAALERHVDGRGAR
ncbi:MAG: thiamine pyrophosphate-dependent enzyme [Actinomycetota bacterium]|nr:thiamine pyrophosphate-dependent enzyme [Actinomycetota bacterium]